MVENWELNVVLVPILQLNNVRLCFTKIRAFEEENSAIEIKMASLKVALLEY